MLDVILYAVAGAILIMLPGFLFSVALYPKAKSLDFWTRMGLSLALGVLIAFYAAYTAARLQAFMLGPFITATSIAAAILIVLVYLRGGVDLVLGYLRGALGLPGRAMKLLNKLGGLKPKKVAKPGKKVSPPEEEEKPEVVSKPEEGEPAAEKPKTETPRPEKKEEKPEASPRPEGEKPSEQEKKDVQE